MPNRIRLERTPGWRKPVGAVVVSRPSKWGNPWRESEGLTKQQCAAAFDRAMEMPRRENPKLIGYPSREEIRRELAGRDLCCWCPESGPCHATTLLRIANEEIPLVTPDDSPAAWPTTYTVSCLPLWHIDCDTYAVTVEYRGGSYTDKAWAVLRHRWCLSSAGAWDLEPPPSERDDQWIMQHRFYRDTALALARQHAPGLKVNGKTAADVFSKDRRC
jgi:hypothetical protein